MSHTVGRSATKKRPVRTKERYILDSLVSVFKGGHWVEDTVGSILSPSQEETHQDGGGGVSASQNGVQSRTDHNPTGTAYITIIGGQKYDRHDLTNYLSKRTEEVAVVGAGRGVESDIAKDALAPVVSIEVDQDRYGKNARKVNVEEVLCYAIDSPLLLVGDGERVKQARAWLKRTNSRREVVELP